jgi:hypothetical protein
MKLMELGELFMWLWRCGVYLFGGTAKRISREEVRADDIFWLVLEEKDQIVRGGLGGQF